MALSANKACEFVYTQFAIRVVPACVPACVPERGAFPGCKT